MRIKVTSYAPGRKDSGTVALFYGRETICHIRDFYLSNDIFRKVSDYVVITDLDGGIVHLGICVTDDIKEKIILDNPKVNSSLRAGRQFKLHLPQVTVETKEGDEPKYSLKERGGIFYIAGTGWEPEILEVDENFKPPAKYEMTADSKRPEHIPEISEKELRIEAELSAIDKIFNKKSKKKRKKSSDKYEESADLNLLDEKEDADEEKEVVEAEEEKKDDKKNRPESDLGYLDDLEDFEG